MPRGPGPLTASSDATQPVTIPAFVAFPTSIEDRLHVLKRLYAQDVITKADHRAKRRQKQSAEEVIARSMNTTAP